MVSVHQTSFLLVVYVLYLGLSLNMVEAASCPAPRINASEVCEGEERNDVESSPNLTRVVCGNLQNLTRVNRTFILQALEFGLRKNEEYPLDILKVLFSQVDGEELEIALEEFHHKVANSTLMSPQWKTIILRALWDEKLQNENRFNETAFVISWFQERLRPFISAVSTDMLRCLHNKNMQCAQYQAVIKGLDTEFMQMSPPTREAIFHSFQLPYLEKSRSSGAACAEGLDNATWLMINFRRFSKYAKYQDLVALNSEFNGVDVLKDLTVTQLGQLSATGGALKTPADVQNVMEFIDPSTVTEYIDEFNRQVNISFSAEIQASLLEHVLALVRLIFQRADDAEFMLWMEQRLPVLIPGLNSTLVPLLFDHLEPRNVSAIRAVTLLLNNSIDEFSNATRQSIYKAILTVTSNFSLQYYDRNSSFVVFLKESFQRFEDFLTLRDVESVVPVSDLQKVVNTIPPDALADLFSRKGFLNTNSFLTDVLQTYKRNGAFMDRWNQKGIIGSLSNDTKLALLAGVWLTVVTSSNNTEVDLWLDGRLAHYFVFLNGAMLNTSETLNASCATFRKIISKLNKNREVFEGREEELYFSIKAYLTATKDRPRCFNATDSEASDWLVTYLGHYIRYSSARDMRLLTNRSAATLQGLASNPDNLELITKTRIRKDLAEMFAAALFAVDSEFSLESLPDQLLCFARHSTLISALSPADALSLIARVNRNCNSPKPSASDRQLATMLVAQVKTLNGQALVALGQQAIGLTGAQISNLAAHALLDARVLESLGQVNGWNRGQSQALLNKILLSNFTLDTAEKFERLGTLAQALPSTSFEKISAELAVGLAKKPGFLATLQQGPGHLKKAFVRKILSNSSSLSDILNHVPDDLVDQVPNVRLAFRGSIPDLHKINEKHWSPQQAAVFFGDVLSRADNYTQLSPFVLQGFQCSVASKLTPGRMSFLAKEVKVKNAILSDEQLSCMVKLLIRSNWTMENFTHYSADLLLFFPLNGVDALNCRTFYALASQGNLSLLANRSVQRTTLLEKALSCFGVGNTSLSKQQLRELGAFVCDMDTATIRDSDSGILENLKRCPDLTASQRTALNTRLSSGKTAYGLPGSWDEETLESLGPLAFHINSTTWNSINQEERTVFFKNVADGYDSQSASQRERTIFFLKSVGSKPASSLRTKRAAETCRSTPITADTMKDPLFMVRYNSTQQFDACLSNEVLKASLASLLEQPLPNNYLAVIRRKLDELYPGGIPEEQLKALGFLARQYDVDAIGRWNVTSPDTLAALLNQDNGAWEQPQLRRLVGRYMELGGTLAGPLLAMLGGEYLCFLDEDQLKQISPESIRNAEKLDVSSCSQGMKDLLYEKAHTAFANQEGTRAYYPLIQPYLGGAPVEDLKKLAGSEIAMDINTFTNLKPEELKKLSTQDVKSLLGVNLPDLKEVENHPSVALWIQSHLQSELDGLGLGLAGGVATLTSTPSSSSSSSTIAGSSVGVERNSTPITPTGGATVSVTRNIATSNNATNNVPSTITTAALTFVPLTAAVDSHSTPVFQITTVAKDRPTSVDATSTALPTIVKDPKAAFPTGVTATTFSVTTTSEEAISGTPAPTTVTKNTTTSREAIEDSNTTSTALPTIVKDPKAAFSTSVTVAPFSVTTTSEEAISGTPAPATVTKNTTTSREATEDSNTTSTAFPTIVKDPKAAFPTNVTATPFTVTTTLEEAISGTPAPATVTKNTTTSRETTEDSNTTSTAFPTIVKDPKAAFSTSVTATPFSVTTTSEEAISGTPAPTTVTKNTTTSREAIEDSNTTSTALPTTPKDSNTAVPTNFMGSSSITAASNNNNIVSRTFATATHTNVSTSVETTGPSSITTTKHSALHTSSTETNTATAIKATNSHTLAIGINHTFSVSVETRAPTITVPSSEVPPAPPKLIPNATIPVPLSTTTKTTHKNKPSKFTVHVPETSHKTGVPPRPVQTTPFTVTRRTTNRSVPKTKPPTYPTPNGYINVNPISGSVSNSSLRWLLPMLFLTVGISALGLLL